MKPKPLQEEPDEEQKESRYHRLIWPKNYVPLQENQNESEERAREEKKAKKKRKYKKYRKNMKKVLRYSWKCLMMGLQNLAVGYSAPLSAVAMLGPEFKTQGSETFSVS